MHYGHLVFELMMLIDKISKWSEPRLRTSQYDLFEWVLHAHAIFKAFIKHLSRLFNPFLHLFQTGPHYPGSCALTIILSLVLGIFDAVVTGENQSEEKIIFAVASRGPPHLRLPVIQDYTIIKFLDTKPCPDQQNVCKTS